MRIKFIPLMTSLFLGFFPAYAQESETDSDSASTEGGGRLKATVQIYINSGEVNPHDSVYGVRFMSKNIGVEEATLRSTLAWACMYPNMHMLDLSGLQLPSSARSFFFKELKHFPKLRALILRDANISDDDVGLLLANLKHTPDLNYLDMSFNKDIQAPWIISTLDNAMKQRRGALRLNGVNSKTQKFHFGQLYQSLSFGTKTDMNLGVVTEIAYPKECSNKENRNAIPFSEEQKKQIYFSLLEKIQTLRHINIDGMNLTDSDLVLLRSAFQHHQNVKALFLGHNGLRPLSMALAKDIVLDHPTITDLSLGTNALGDQGLAALCFNLRPIRILELGNNGITREGMLNFSLMPHFDDLGSLNLGGNPLGDAGAISLSNILKTNKTMERLLLSKCGIGDKGAAALAQALEGHPSLLRLDLGKNKMTSKGSFDIAKLLLSLEKIQSLSLHENRFDQESALILSTFLEQNTTLTELDLSDTGISDEGVIDLAQSLSRNRTLRTLSLQNNNLTDISAVHLQKVLRENPKFVHLNLFFNMLTVEMSQSLQELVESINKKIVIGRQIHQ